MQEGHEDLMLHCHHLTACGLLGIFYLNGAGNLPTVCSFYLCISAKAQAVAVNRRS